VPTIVIPFRVDKAKSRLPRDVRDGVAHAMFDHVYEVCAAVATTVVADGAGGQGAAVEAALRGIEGPVAIVNADLPRATSADIQTLLAAAPALVAAADGTTNALAFRHASDFRPLYGPGSARRFRALGLRSLDLPGLAEDVDTLADFQRLCQVPA
jgi:2-phospho-L-lactate guanylyltransferase (CobY/MobA/RfbA family)